MTEDAQEVKEILEVVSEKVPKLLEEITEALFSPEKAEKFGETVAKFYKSMVDSGMSPDQAFELTQKFMDSSSPGGMIANALGGLGGSGNVHKEVHIHGGGHDENCCGVSWLHASMNREYLGRDPGAPRRPGRGYRIAPTLALSRRWSTLSNPLDNNTIHTIVF